MDYVPSCQYYVLATTTTRSSSRGSVPNWSFHCLCNPVCPSYWKSSFFFLSSLLIFQQHRLLKRSMFHIIYLKYDNLSWDIHALSEKSGWFLNYGTLRNHLQHNVQRHEYFLYHVSSKCSFCFIHRENHCLHNSDVYRSKEAF